MLFRSSFDYEFLDTFTAGIVLSGTEIKSIMSPKGDVSKAPSLLNNCTPLGPYLNQVQRLLCEVIVKFKLNTGDKQVLQKDMWLWFLSWAQDLLRLSQPPTHSMTHMAV